MRQKHLAAAALTLALALGVWAAAVTFTPIVASFSAGTEVSAATFNDLFDDIQGNFDAAKGAIDALEAFDAALVGGACPAGEHFQAVGADGTPVCAPSGLALPFEADADVAAGEHAFGIQNTGAGGLARFSVANGANVGIALDAVSNGQAQSLALRAQHFGLGSAAFFQNSNDGSSSDTIRVVNANRANGGRAGYFEIFSAENASTALEAQATSGRAGRFVNTATNAILPALEVVNATPGTAALLVSNTGGTGAAAFFSGGVVVSGNLSATGTKNFRIDHPLAPDRMYLNHFAVESDEVSNLYAGNVVLDDRGAAWVELPSYFEALNAEVRYQLTAIGAPAPNLHVASEVAGNRFQVAGGEPGMRVSWQLTALRDDPAARLLRAPVEEPKPAAEIGTFLLPEAYGLPAERGLAAHLGSRR